MQARVIDEFLTRSSGQLTYTGLLQLHESTKERELSVFFRNNHFNCMFKVCAKLRRGGACGAAPGGGGCASARARQLPTTATTSVDMCPRAFRDSTTTSCTC